MSDLLKKNIKIIFAYDGSIFSGLQKQKNALTAANEIEKAIKKLFKKKVNLIIASRVDAAAHCLNAVGNFFVETNMTESEIKNALNSVIHKNISIKAVSIENENFHSRYSAKKREYIYLIYNSKEKNVFLNNYALWIKEKIDIKKLNQYLKVFKGKHNFISFTKKNLYKNTQREIFKIKCSRRGKIIIIQIEANGFLYNMIRNIIGCCLYFIKKDIVKEEIEKYLEEYKQPLWKKVDAQGLYLYKIDY